MKKIRITYEKNEEVKYIGHLDTITMFDRTFRRANIILKFSQGFSPKANMSFALPTSTGIVSKCEYMEFETDDDEIDLKNLKTKLDEFLPNGFKVIQIEFIEDKKSLMSKVKKAEYLIKIYLKEIEKNNNILQKIFNSDEVLVENKKNIIINIKSYIIKIDIKNVEDGIEINVLGTAGSVNNLRPDLIIKVIEKENINILDYEIVRKKLILEE